MRNLKTCLAVLVFASLSLQIYAQTSDPTPYNRSDYMTSWLDQNGNCRNTRNEVLIEESLIEPVMSANGCVVVSGLWYDPFTDREFTNPRSLDIDHLVPLAEAHVSGAWLWSRDRKRDYANDLDNPDALIAVSASANRSKGARDPAGWLPPNVGYHCHYVKSWLWIKHVNQLEMDLEERAAIERVLGAPVEAVMLTDEQASLILRWLVLFTSQCKG